MNKNRLIAALLTVLFLIPVLTALGEPVFSISLDENAVLRGMDRSWSQGYTASDSKGRWNLIVPVRVEGGAESVTAELKMQNPGISPFKTQDMTVEAQEEEEHIWGIRFGLSMLAEPKNGDYPCEIHITARNQAGQKQELDILHTVRVRSGTEMLEKSRIDVTGVEAELHVGEKGEVRLTLSNPCKATELENIELKMSDAEGHILPRGAETLQAGNLAPGESIAATYPVTVLAKATVVPHILKIDLNWTAAGQEMTSTSNYTVAIHQTIRLEQGGVKMARSVYAGDSVTLSVPLMNMGRANVVNVLATVAMPGITDRQSALVGTIQPGETRQAQIILTPGKETEGDYTGTLTVECTDEDGNPASFELPLELNVEKPVRKETEEGKESGTEKKEKNSPLILALGGGCGVLLILLLLQGILLRRKIHRLEEDRL